MKINKRWLISLFVFFLPVVLLAQERNTLPLKGDLTLGIRVAIDLSRFSLYEIVAKQLQEYYQKTDFSDPQRETGWYRVDNFLTWLKENETNLTQELEQFPLDGRYKQRLWIYLGARYVADMYHTHPDSTKLNIRECSEHENECARMEDTTILFNSFRSQVAPVAIALGMHEGSHLLPALLQEEPVSALSELVSFYSQHEYGLPVKVEDANFFSQGIRDFRLTSSRKGFSLVPLTHEYMLHIVGLAFLQELIPEQMLANSVELSKYSNITLADTVIYWHAINKQQLFIGTNVYTPELFLENLLGSLAKNRLIYTKTYAFLNELDKNLPENLQERIEKYFPIIEKDTSRLKEVSDFLEDSQLSLVNAVIKALQKVRAPLPPPLPPGYL